MNDFGEMLHLDVIDDGSMLNFLSDQTSQLKRLVLRRTQEISDKSINSVMKMLTRIVQANPPVLLELSLCELGTTSD